MIAFVVLMLSVEASRAWSLRQGDIGDFITFVVTELWFTGGLALAAVGGPILGAALGRRATAGMLLTAATTVSAVGVGIGLLYALSDGPIAPAVRDGYVHSNLAFALRSLWFYSMAGLLFAAYCAVREHHMALTRAVRAAELERAAMQRNVVESRFKVLQARIEPEFLFDALERVQALYRDDLPGAERALDRLIGYLRAALPRMRGEASTLGHEIDLVRAYLDVLRVLSERGVEVATELAPELAGLSFPPMVLLPIVQAAFAGAGGPRRRIAIEATGQGGVSRLVIALEGGECPEGWRTGGLPGSCEALRNAFGNDTEISFHTAGDRHRIVIGLGPSASATPRNPATAF